MIPSLRAVRRLLMFALLPLMALAGAGCGPEDDLQPAQLSLQGDAVRTALLGSEVQIQIVVEGPTLRTALGGTEDTTVSGVRVAFALTEQPQQGGTRLESQEARTDQGGRAITTLSVGSAPGVCKVRVHLPDYPAIRPTTVTILAGIAIHGDHQDAEAGDTLVRPLSVYAEAAPGKAFPGVRVEFKPDKGVTLLSAEGATDETGIAEAVIKLTGKMGRRNVGVRILSGPWANAEPSAAIHAPFFALDWSTLVIEVLGGLAIFIFGMRHMSEGLALVAGNRLRRILDVLTKNRFFAVIAGLVTTGLIQSSSACSVMVIGFVNAGLMRLEQAIGVLMGANIGTTVTAQMLSFKLGVIALPTIAAGVVLSLVASRQTTRFWAQIMIGFGLLFFGMELMGAPLKLLKDSATIISFFDGLSCRPEQGCTIPLSMLFKAIAAGTLMTVIVQSSSASIGLLLAMAGAGLLDAYTATAVLLGDNIGTTITAVIASIGSSTTAKRAACSHVLFNVGGVLVMIALFYVPWNDQPIFMELINRVTPGNAFEGENIVRFLANAHTGFNVTCTVVFIWFVTVFAAICRRLIPGVEEAASPQRLLEPHLLATPGIAIGQAWSEVGVMVRKSQEAHGMSVEALVEPGTPRWEEIDQNVRELERQIDDLQGAVNAYVMRLSMETLTEEQSGSLPNLLHSVNDAERLGDHSMQLLRLARRCRKQSVALPGPAVDNLRSLNETLNSMFELCAQTLEQSETLRSEVEAHARLQKGRELNKALKRQIKDARKAHEARIGDNSQSIPGGVVFINTLTSVQRVGGHLENILQALLLEHPAEASTS